MSNDVRQNIYHTTFVATINRGKTQEEATAAAKQAVADFDTSFPPEAPKTA